MALHPMWGQPPSAVRPGEDRRSFAPPDSRGWLSPQVLFQTNTASAGTGRWPFKPQLLGSYASYLCSPFGGAGLCGGGLDLCGCAGFELFSFGGFDWGALAASCELLEFGFVNGRNPPSGFALLPAGAPTRASLGDMAGA